MMLCQYLTLGYFISLNTQRRFAEKLGNELMHDK